MRIYNGLKYMAKLCSITKNIILLFSCLFLLSASAGISLAKDQEAILVREEPVIYAPEGLDAKEQRVLERGYRYQFRHKDIIEEPFLSTPFVEEPSISSIDGETMNQAEKLYRYFGIASVFYRIGKLEEALEILEYIVSIKPDDEYVKRYLNNVKSELKKKEEKWRITSRKDTSRLKKERVNELVQEGTVHYKQKRFNLALLNFADVLNLDPDNAIAKSYMNKIRKIYLKEIQVGNIIRTWKSETGEDMESTARFGGKAKVQQVSPIVAGLLDEVEFKEKGFSRKTMKATTELLDKAESKEGKFVSEKQEKAVRNMLNDEEVKGMIESARIDVLMDQAELNLHVRDIIARQKMEEKKKVSYTLGPGDVLQIGVQDHAELSGGTSVGPSGSIMLPLVNELVQAQGLTVEELEVNIKEALKRYVRDPVVYAVITGYNSKIFYVLDEASCTPYNITRANFTLRDALFMADWGDNRALGRILVMKPHKFNPLIRKIDGFDLIYRGNLSRNIRIENGDVIYIPMTAASKIAQTVSDALSPVAAVRQIRDEWINMRWNREQGWDNLFRIPRTGALQRNYRGHAAEGD